MSDWVAASRRTTWYLLAAGALFIVGASAGIISPANHSPLDLVADFGLLSLLLISIVLAVWAAVQCPKRSLLRAGWLTTALGYAIVTVVAGWMAAGDWTSPDYVFNGASPLFTLALVVIGAGLWMNALSVGFPERPTREFVLAFALSVLVFVLMLVALLAPGPSMPFSIGPRDGGGILRLLIDSFLILLPMSFATGLQLRSVSAHRARAWMAGGGGALMICMGDAVNPLVDLGHGQIYPVALWCLGFILITVSASLTADFERAERGLDSATGALEATGE